MSIYKSENFKGFYTEIYKQVLLKNKLNKRSVEKIASTYAITDRNTVKEITESAIVTVTRQISLNKETTTIQKFEKIVEYYNVQVNLSQRTSKSVKDQQYSTPATIAFLLGRYCQIYKKGNYYEPSAGNGMLTIASDGSDFIVNEIDPVRNDNLVHQNIYKEVTKNDSSLESYKLKYFDAVLTNPPFDAIKEPENYLTIDDFTIKYLDHKMAILALNAMKDNGRCSIIIGGHTEWDDEGRVQGGKNRIMLSYLYKHYNVDDIINIDSQKLYSKMGTGFPVRLILINGRKKKPAGFAPRKMNSEFETVSTPGQLFLRISKYFETDTLNEVQKVALIDTKNKLELRKRKLNLLKHKLLLID
jgi:hypothetical protein